MASDRRAGLLEAQDAPTAAGDEGEALSAFASASHRFLQAEDLSDLSLTICEQACRVLGADGALLFEASSGKGAACPLLAAHGVPSGFVHWLGNHPVFAPASRSDPWREEQARVRLSTSRRPRVFRREFFLKLGHHAAVFLPLASGGASRCGLAVSYGALRRFTRRDLSLARAFADMAALALARARLEASRHAREARRRALVGAMDMLSACREGGEILDGVFSACAGVLGTGRVCIRLIEPPEGRERRFPAPLFSPRFAAWYAACPLPPPGGAGRGGERSVARGGAEAGKFLAEENLRSCAALPLRCGGSVVGEFEIFWPTSGRMGGEERAAGAVLADGVAAAFVRVWDKERERAHSLQLRHLLRLSGELANRSDPPSIFEVVAKAGEEILGAERCAVWLAQPRGGFSCAWRKGISADYVRWVESTPGERTGLMTARRARPLFIPDAEAALSGSPLGPVMAREGVRAFLHLPLRKEGMGFGWVTYYFDRKMSLPENFWEIAGSFADNASVAIVKAHLLDEARRRASRQGALGRIAKAVGSTLEPGVLFRAIVDEIRRAIPCDRCVIGSVDPITGDSDYWNLTADADVGEADRPPRVRLDAGKWFGRHVYATRRPVRIDRLDEVGAQWARRLCAMGLKSLIAAPVIQGEACPAHVSLTSRRGCAFTDEHLALLEAITDFIGPAIRNAALFREAGERASRLSMLHELNLKIASNLNLSQVLDAIAESAGKLLKADVVQIFLPDEESGLWVNRGAYTSIPDCPLPETSCHFGEGMVGAVARMDELFAVPDVRAEERWLRRDWGRRWGIRSYAAQPLRRKGQGIGVIEFMSRKRNFFEAIDRELLDFLVSQAAIAIKNASLHEEERRSRHFLQSVVGGAADPIIITDLEGRITFWNGGAEALYGFRAEEAAGRHINFLIPERHQRDAQGHSALVRQEGRAFTYETELCRRGGATLPVSVTVSPVKGDDGRVIAVSSVHKDLTEGKRAEEHLRQSCKLQAIGELASGIAHDFNNLLAIILGRAQLLRMTKDRVKIDRALAVIEKAAQNGARTIKRLQDFSRKREPGRREAVDVNEVVRDVAEMTRPRWKVQPERAGVTVDLRLDLTAEHPIVHGEAAELQEALINLVTNAVDAMPDGGVLTLATRDTRHGIEVSVWDTGVGMSPEVRERALEPFFSTKGERGTGMGLSMVYGLVKRHGGTLAIESEAGAGTAVRIVIPVEPGASVRERRVQILEAPPSRIMVIEDEAEIANALARMLRVAGHTVDLRTDPREGIAQISRKPYDAVLTDLGMPRFSGWDVARAVKEQRPDVPIILITGWGVELDHERLRRSGVAEVVAKPFWKSTVLNSLARALRERKAREESGTAGRPA